MSEEQEITATAEATADQAETQESQATSEAGGSQTQQPTGYESFTLPDGATFNDEQASDYNAWAKDLGLDQTQAQKAVDKHFEWINKAHERGTQAQEAMHSEWATETRSDKEFGGSNLSENIAGARKAMNSFSQPAVNDGKPVLHQEGPMKGQQMTEMEVFMNDSGWGNHPAVIRVFHRISKAMSEDSFVSGSLAPPSTKKTQAEVMYPPKEG